MKKLLLVLAAIVLIAAFVYAGDDFTPKAAGAESLNFTFGGLGAFNLGGAGPSVSVPTPAFVPAGISVSYFLNTTAAVRVGLQIQNQSQTLPWNGAAGGSDGSESAFAAGITADYLSYMGSSSNRVRPYLGGGFLFTLSSNDHKSAVAAGATQTEVQNSTPAGITAAVVGIAGAEFFFYNEISVSAEYQLNIFGIQSFSDTKTTTGTVSTTTKNGSGTQILGFGALGATVHIYF